MANHMNQNPKTGKKRGTKAALAASFAALLLCGATLVGTTFAWFTDTATTGNNTIKAGNLDLEVEYSYDLETWNKLKTENDVKIFDHAQANTANDDSTDTLWEPNKTQIVYFKLTNVGNLDQKYQVILDAVDATPEDDAEGVDMRDVMEYKIIPDADTKISETTWEALKVEAKQAPKGEAVVSGTESNSFVELKKGATHNFALAVHMDKQADNKYMNDVVEFTLSFEATQLASENDSFDHQYDADARVRPQATVTMPTAGITPQKITQNHEANGIELDCAVMAKPDGIADAKGYLNYAITFNKNLAFTTETVYGQTVGGIPVWVAKIPYNPDATPSSTDTLLDVETMNMGGGRVLSDITANTPYLVIDIDRLNETDRNEAKQLCSYEAFANDTHTFDLGMINYDAALAAENGTNPVDMTDVVATIELRFYPVNENNVVDENTYSVLSTSTHTFQ